jgi:cytochrome c
VIWDAATLDQWLENPESVVPDNDMPFRLDHKDERAAIIEYLRGLGAR